MTKPSERAKKGLKCRKCGERTNTTAAVPRCANCGADLKPKKTK